MSSVERQSTTHKDHLKIGGLVAIAMGVTNLIDLNNSVQTDLAKEMVKPTSAVVHDAENVLAHARDTLLMTENSQIILKKDQINNNTITDTWINIFNKPEVKEATKIINQKDAFYTEAWNRLGGDNKPRIVFDAFLIGAGIALRNKIKSLEKQEGEEAARHEKQRTRFK